MHYSIIYIIKDASKLKEKDFRLIRNDAAWIWLVPFIKIDRYFISL